jgi:release factor glutamine methyltransferase
MATLSYAGLTVAAATAAIARALHDLAGNDREARLEAEVLVRHALGLGYDRAAYARILTNALSADEATTLALLVERRLTGEPIPYITGIQEFYGIPIAVDHRVLIPRPETEGLVERCLAFLKPRGGALIADVGTGSGCIAIALAIHHPGVSIYASDISADALAVAQENARRYGLAHRITFLLGDGLPVLPQPVDIIVSNPPYIPAPTYEAWPPHRRAYEPRTALVGGDDGLAVIRQLMADAPRYLCPGGALFLEVGEGQEQAVTALGQQAFPDGRITVEPDLAGHPRYVCIVTGGDPR